MKENLDIVFAWSTWDFCYVLFSLCINLTIFTPTEKKTKPNKKMPKSENNTAQRSPISLTLFRNKRIYSQRTHNSRFWLLSTVEKRQVTTCFFQLPAVTEMHWSLRVERGLKDGFSTSSGPIPAQPDLAAALPPYRSSLYIMAFPKQPILHLILRFF